MSKIKRLIDIWLYINRRKDFTAQELADEFNVSIRTIQRDLLELTEMGVPFYSEVGRNGGYSMLHGEMLPPVSFTEEETASVIFTYESLKQYQDIPYEAEIDSVTYKLLAQVSEPLRNRLISIQKHMFMKIPLRIEKTPFLKTIFRASITNQILFFYYDSLDTRKEKTAIPIGIYSENGYWYFPAYDLNHDRISLFRADRIIELREGSISKIELPHLKQWLNERSSIPTENPCELVLRISRKAVRGFSNPFFEFSKITWEDENTGILHQYVSRCEFPYIASLISTFGPEAVILDPPELKDLFINRLRDTLAIYGEK
ncbi:YafY family protein [Desulfosporosinus sp. OT]|uniref:helix-turn-helix transcriptional regulator n=1 Tax=Desulfosporosinus sp. OT TaxID=913865 RepID=UPI000223B24B|nr:YafY family protein [Desulfosporosinus sp. OT]EGW38811.1 deoR-like helix-turn-helix domain protein [Desulfosporosinus sp. OT]